MCLIAKWADLTTPTQVTTTTAGTERFVVSQNYNTAARLHRLMSMAKQQPQGESTVNAWARLFNIPPKEHNRRYMAVTQKLQLVLGEVDRLEQQMQSTPLRPHTYQEPLEQLRKALDATAMTNHFSQYTQYINDFTLNALDTYADLLPSQGEPIDEDELRELAKTLAELRGQVEESESLPEDIRSFLLRQIQVLQDALNNYPIMGSAAFLQAQGLGAALVTIERDVVEQYPDNEEVQSYLHRLGSAWQFIKERVQDLETMQKMLTAGTWVASKAMLALSDGTGNLPPLV